MRGSDRRIHHIQRTHLVVLVLALRGVWPDWSGWSWWARGWRLSLLVGGGAAVYVGLLLLQGLRPRDLRG